MSKYYEIHAKFGKAWVCVETKPLQADALHYVEKHSGERYPMKVIRVVKTVVFEEK